MKKKRMLITGISGLLGNNLAWCLREQYDILGLYHGHKIRMDGVRVAKCDLLSRDSIQKQLSEFCPDIIVHCAALSNIDICEQDRDHAHQINVAGTKHVLSSIAKMDTKLVYISTDTLYADSPQKLLDENSPIEPANYYAETKLLAEQECLKNKRALVLRTNIFGWNIQNKQSLSEWILHKLQNQKEFPGFEDVMFSSIYTFDLAKALDLAVEKDLCGIYNVGSRTSISKYAFAEKIAEELGLNAQLVKPGSVADINLAAKRRTNLALDVSKIEKDLDCKLPRIEESIRHFCRDHQDGIAKKIKACLYPQLDIIPYGRQMVDENDIQAVVDVLRSGNLTQGPKISEFESLLKDSSGAKHCVAVNTGTAALHLACLAIGIKEGDEVITSPNSFVASSNCVMYCGGTPVFADIDEKTYNVTASSIAEKITAKTKAVLPVHFAGQSCDMEAIQKVVREKEKEFQTRIFIIEDAAHALGSKYKNKHVGSCAFSDMVTVSFHPVKHITTAEGGAVFTNDTALATKLITLRSHGITGYEEQFTADKDTYYDEKGNRRAWYYEQQMLGFNFRITDVHCALGISQLKKLPFFMSRRREIVDYYNAQFAGLKGLTIPFEHPDCQNNFHLYVVLMDFAKVGKTRAEVMQALLEKNIRTQVHYIPIYRQPYYVQKFGRQQKKYPREERYYEQCLSLPLYPAMTMEDVGQVVKAVKEIVV